MDEPEWVLKSVVLALHDEQLAEHGGRVGVRDEGLLESALARPQNVFAFGGQTDLPALAAAYAVGIAKNHAFIDGNKRVSNVVTFMFLALNGRNLQADAAEQLRVWLAIADGSMSEEQVADWIRNRI
ncbi:MAG: death on curing protein [Methylobacteriaceae bacterium]|jgi:death-on-curing protein|nr:death on curing protein [Methylobacteriaceae bacterium]